ncbi:early nodulin-20 [Olea europaea var. sylvestris]|uniref:early nodulin-20 n=1 Tax=Olea europaea var. sylvestris TaxID=158386 RepID=UPI000C1D2580|nr:early nodulin-20 [Olea europaea var. sylvestris]
MGFSSMLIFFYFVVTLLLQFQLSESATVVVDGVSEWRNPQVQVGDAVIFQHKYRYNLYIFQNQNAFSLCNFSQATLLTKPNSTSYTWHTSRPGFFYFSFNNGSNKACLEGQKLTVKVTLSAPPNASPELPPPTAAPPLSSGGVVASSPAFPWPFQPRENASPSPAPSTVELPGGDTSPTAPDKEGIPFINSNPAVPLPAGEVDSATIRPLPTNGDHVRQVLGFSFFRRALSLSCPILLMMV